MVGEETEGRKEGGRKKRMERIKERGRKRMKEGRGRRRRGRGGWEERGNVEKVIRMKKKEEKGDREKGEES